MGVYRLVVEASGGHGCERQIKDGGKVFGCGRRDCPDCEAREFVQRLMAKGNQVRVAELRHWPETPQEVLDNLLTRERRGSF